jgi:hypothetical protein
MITPWVISKLALAFCIGGAAAFITGCLPEDKMNRVRALLGDTKKYKNQPPVRAQLLIGGALILFLGLVMLGVVRMPSLGGQVDVPKKTERPKRY